jgi:recombinational DNA repair protein (RecF pathway)
VLKKEKLRENEFIYTIFTYDYGKIKAIKKESKKEKMLDL